MNENTLKKSTHFISIIFNVASIIAIIVDIGAILLLGGYIIKPDYASWIFSKTNDKCRNGISV